MMSRAILGAVFFLLLAVVPPAEAKRAHLERDYQAQWCAEKGGQAEVVLPDGTRADCLTATHAIEFDFGSKWAEAIGQALFYGLQTGKRPGDCLDPGRREGSAVLAPAQLHHSALQPAD